jgi:hypothetical protein
MISQVNKTLHGIGVKRPTPPHELYVNLEFGEFGIWGTSIKL